MDSFEVIVVDNASSDGSAEMTAREFPSVKLIANEENLSFAAGCNQGARASGGETLLLLNPDACVHEDTLTNALVFLDSNPQVGAVGARQLSPGGATQQSIRGFPNPKSIAWEILGLRRIFPHSHRFGAYRASWLNYNAPAEVDQPMATFLMTRREAYFGVGGMDENFPLFFNDVDLCLRMKQAGWKICYTPAIRITHYGGAGTKLLAPPELILSSHASMLRFYEKHYQSEMPKPCFLFAKAAIMAGGMLRASLSAFKR
jgi:GT2 family glycosyltransferase